MEKYEHLRALQLTFSLLPQAKWLLYLGAVFARDTNEDNFNFLSENVVSKEQAFLRHLTTHEGNAASAQRQLLAALEWLCAVKSPQVCPTAVAVSKLCMQLYELEILEEECFLSWAKDTVLNQFSISAQYGMTYDAAEKVKEHAQPFLTWLETAEDDEEEEEEEEGDDEEDA